MYEIEKGYPIPEKFERKAYRGKYPFRNMEAGDSFFVGEGDSNKVSLYNCCNYWKAILGREFVVRAVDGGFRVWRVK